MTPLLPLQQIPASIAAVSDYEPFARERMTPQAWAYMAGGAADELTLGENRSAFQRVRLLNRVLEDLSGGHTRLQLCGLELDYPILLAPVAFQQLAHPDGELASVLGASAMKAAMVVSTQAGISLEDIAEAAQTPLWFQLYIQPDRDFTLALVRRAEAAGYRALVVTVDAPVSGLRNREQRAGFVLPEGIEAVNLKGMRALPPAVARPGESPLFGSPLLEQAVTWSDLTWLQAHTRLPVLLKGVMNPGMRRGPWSRAWPASSSPTTAVAPWMACRQRSTCSRAWSRQCRGGCRCCWMAVSVVAPTCSRRWRWVPAR